MCVEQLSVEEMYNNCCEDIPHLPDSDWEDEKAEILKALEAAGLTFGGTKGQNEPTEIEPTEKSNSTYIPKSEWV